MSSKHGVCNYPVLLLALLLAGCSEELQSVEAVVDREGGQIRHPAGASLGVPSAAVEHKVLRIEVAAPTAAIPQGWTEASPAFAFTPHGTTFEAPVTVSLPLETPGAQSVVVWRLEDESDQSWERIDEVTVRDGLAIFETNRFSIYLASGRSTASSSDDGGAPSGRRADVGGPSGPSGPRVDARGPKADVGGGSSPCGTCPAGQVCGADGRCQLPPPPGPTLKLDAGS